MLSVVTFFLALAFGWAALAKAFRPSAWRRALRGYRLPGPVETIAAWAVPAAEALVAGLLIGGPARAGGALAVALLSAFSIAILRARRLGGGKLPCGCFGGAGSRDYRLMLVRNALLGGLAGAALLLPEETLRPLDAPEGVDLLPAVLAFLGIVLIVWLLVQVLPRRRPGR
ncbi:MAG: hypothetical protein M3273_03005 [Actinomycetota bacterium]|nr:hypothetical protein [Actinomycetota bacterium]